MAILDQIKSSLEVKDSNLYQARITHLKKQYEDISHLTDGVKAVEEKLTKGEKSFVIYGEPQSGKTELMLALTCKLLDMGYETIFIVMNDNVSLENQNFDRFAACRQLDPQPIKSADLISDHSSIVPGQKHVIFCRKNKTILEKVIETTRKCGKRVILDDEADFASPDNKVNKKEDASKINELVGKLIRTGPRSELFQKGTYIGVTATPGRLDLNNTFFNKATEWVFLDPYPGYVGREDFFPISRADSKELSYHLKTLSDDYDSPGLLKHAVLRFLLRNSYLNLSVSNEEREPFSMLIHISGRIDDHVVERVQVQQILNALRSDNSPKQERIFNLLDKEAQKIFTAEQKQKIPVVEVLRFIYENRGKSKILVINSKKENEGNPQRAANPQAQFTFALGGNIISRGLTFKNLLSFFFTRTVKGKLQQNTYIQRARMFGNRPELEFFELTVPNELWGNWIDCFMLHELALASAKEGKPRWFYNKKTSAADAGSIQKAYVNIESGEIQVGDIFKLNDEIVSILVDSTKKPLGRITKLISSGLISDSAFPKEYLDVFNNLPTSERLFKLVTPNNQIHLLKYSDANQKNISRERGGMIQATINKIPEYENARQLIMPIKNNNDMCRFYYKSNVGHSMLINRRNKNF